MLTIYKNPYQTRLITTIRDHKVEGKTTKLILADTIAYPNTRGVDEEIMINGNLPVTISLENNKLVHTIASPLEEERIELSSSFEKRFLNQRLFSLQYIFTYYAQVFLGDNKLDYKPAWVQKTSSGSEQVNFQMLVQGAFSEKLGRSFVDYLCTNTRHLIQRGIDMRSRRRRNGQVDTILYGLHTDPWPGPHLFSSSEIQSFKMTDFHLSDQVLTLTFTLTV